MNSIPISEDEIFSTNNYHRNPPLHLYLCKNVPFQEYEYKRLLASLHSKHAHISQCFPDNNRDQNPSIMFTYAEVPNMQKKPSDFIHTPGKVNSYISIHMGFYGSY